MVFRIPHTFHPEFGGLGTVVGYRRLAEPRMLECLSSGDTLGGVVHKYLLEKIEKQLQERCRSRNDIL